MAIQFVRAMWEGDTSLTIATTSVPVGNSLVIALVTYTVSENPTPATSDATITITQRVTAGDNDTMELNTADVDDEIEVGDTISQSGGSSPNYTGFVEYSGGGTDAPVTASTNGSFTAAHNVGPATPAVRDALAVAIIKGQGTATRTPGAGWTEAGEVTVSTECGGMYYKRLMSTAAATCQTVASSSDNYDAAMVIVHGDDADIPADLAAWGSAGTAAGTATSGAACAPTYPGSIAAGDLLLYAAGFRDVATTPDTPSGFTLLDGPRTTSASTGRLWLYGKIATGSESGTETCGSQAVTINRTAQIYRFQGDYTGEAVADVVDTFSWSAPGASATVPDEDVTTPEDYCIACNLVFANDNNTLTPGAGWTEANDIATTPGTGAMLTLNYVESAEAMTVGGVNHTMSLSDPFGVLGFAVHSPSAGGPTSETPTPGGATVQGAAPAARTDTTIAGATVQGTAVTARAAVPQGGATAQGVAPATSTTTPLGGATAAGAVPNAAVPAAQGGLNAAGSAPTAQVPLTIAGLVAGGVAPSVPGAPVSETPIPGGATVAGVGPAAQTSVTAAGASAGGTPPAPGAPTAAGGAVLSGNTLTATATVAIGGATVQGATPTPRAPIVAGGSVTGGNTATVRVTFTPGGLTTGGVAPGEPTGSSETPVPGGATLGGASPTARTTVTRGGLTTGGATPAPAASVNTATIAAQGATQTAIRVTFTPGGATVGGTPPFELGTFVAKFPAGATTSVGPAATTVAVGVAGRTESVGVSGTVKAEP